MSTSFHYDDFRHSASQLLTRLEKRRKQYIRQFYVSWLLFGIAIIIFLLSPAGQVAQPETILPWNTDAQAAASGFDSIISWLPKILSGLSVALLGLYALALPALYRGRNHGTGLNPQHFSLKDSIFSPLVKFFGDWDFSPDAGLLQRQTFGSKILPDYDDFRAEDLLRGKTHGSLVFLAEASLVKHDAGKAKNAFRGIIGVIDISEMGMKLRAPFSGHTVLLADTNKDTRQAAIFDSYQRIPLPTAELEARFEGYSTLPDEAGKILTQPILEQLYALHQQLLSAQEQHTHLDDKIFWGLRRFFATIGTPLSRRANFEKRYDAAHGGKLDLDKANTAHASTAFWDHELQLECREDKIILTLPCPHDLFEPNSMFEPAVLEEDLKLLFALVSTLHGIAGIIDEMLSPKQN